MSRPDRLAAGQVGQRARDTPDTVLGPGRQLEAAAGGLEERLSPGIEGAVAAQAPGGQAAIQATAAPDLSVNRTGHPGSHGR
jgi:hypothetical protein